MAHLQRHWERVEKSGGRYESEDDDDDYGAFYSDDDFYDDDDESDYEDMEFYMCVLYVAIGDLCC